MGFYFPGHNAGYFANTPDDAPVRTIFFYEALCVVSALLWATELPATPCRILIHTDSLNAVEMFHSLKAQKGYNNLLLFMTRLLLHTKTSVRVYHIDGNSNVVADALSQSLFDLALHRHLGLKIRMFQPPRDALGVVNL